MIYLYVIAKYFIQPINLPMNCKLINVTNNKKHNCITQYYFFKYILYRTVKKKFSRKIKYQMGMNDILFKLYSLKFLLILEDLICS